MDRGAPGYSLKGHKESDMTEWLTHTHRHTHTHTHKPFKGDGSREKRT